VKSTDVTMLLLSPPPPLQYAARPLGSYPTIESSSGAGRDPVQSLLEAYPNPQTENQKIVKMLEIIAAHVRTRRLCSSWGVCVCGACGFSSSCQVA
jgi:hypothetical protein